MESKKKLLVFNSAAAILLNNGACMDHVHMLSPEEGLPPTPARWKGANRYEPSKKIGRNQPCPCGSGKKYKKCCL